jgi:transcriptional regulator with XRE-family HTH domain
MKADDINKLIGSRLKRERVRQELTLEEVGKRIGTSLQAVAHHENGRTSITVVRLLLLAKALGKPITFFIEGEKAK